MQRWKAITAVLEKPPECDCGSPVAGDWAYCARCGRELGRRRAVSRTALFSTLAVAGDRQPLAGDGRQVKVAQQADRDDESAEDKKLDPPAERGADIGHGRQPQADAQRRA